MTLHMHMHLSHLHHWAEGHRLAQDFLVALGIILFVAGMIFLIQRYGGDMTYMPATYPSWPGYYPH